MTCDTIQDSLCAMRQVCMDTIYRLNYDSVTVALLKDSQAFYSDSFSDIQWTFGVLITIIIGLLAFFNWRTTSEIKEKFKKIELKIESSKTEFATEIKTQIEAQQNLFDGLLKNQKIEFSNFSANLKKDRDNIIREIARTHLLAAQMDFTNTRDIDVQFHFTRLSIYCSYFWQYKIDLNDEEIRDFDIIDGFMSKCVYDKDSNKNLSVYETMCIVSSKDKVIENAAGYFGSFCTFREYCKNKPEHFKRADRIWRELCNIFGEMDMLDAAKKWGNEYL